MKIFLTGSSSGVGLATKLMLQSNHDVTAPSRAEFDLEDLACIESWDFSTYDVIINCAGANMGAWQGWQNNSWQNQSRHVNINFVAPLLMAKHYTQQRKQGHFIYVTSASVDDPIAYNIFYVTSKAALRYSLDAVKKEHRNFVFTEICPGKIRSNMLKQNYQGTRTDVEIDEMYNKDKCLTSQQVAESIVYALEHQLEKITLVPHQQ